MQMEDPGLPPTSSLGDPPSLRKKLRWRQSHRTCLYSQRLRTAKGMSIAAKDLRATYETWCAAQTKEPLSLPRFAAELKALGCEKWKSCGVMRYRDLQLAT